MDKKEVHDYCCANGSCGNRDNGCINDVITILIAVVILVIRTIVSKCIKSNAVIIIIVNNYRHKMLSVATLALFRLLSINVITDIRGIGDHATYYYYHFRTKCCSIYVCSKWSVCACMYVRPREGVRTCLLLVSCSSWKPLLRY